MPRLPGRPTDAPVEWYPHSARALRDDGFFIERQVMNTTTYHRQPGIEISIGVTGMAAVLNARAEPIVHDARSVVIIPPNWPHQFTCFEGKRFERIAICVDVDHLVAKGCARGQFPLEWLARDRPTFLSLSLADADRLAPISTALLRETTLRGMNWEAYVTALIAQLLVTISRLVVGSSPRAGVARRADLVERTIAHVLPRLSESLTLPDVAGAMGVSPEHLTRSFRSELGLSFHRYLLAERVNLAKRMLTRSDDRLLTDIAWEAGFASSSDFSRVFRRLVGMSPRAYRQMGGRLA